MDERQWIHAIQKGDKRYLTDIAEKYYDDIFRFCAFQTGSREDAYDLAQETFLRFIRYVEGYRHRNLKGYLLTIAMNVCRNYLRRKGREERMMVPGGEEWQREESRRQGKGWKPGEDWRYGEGRDEESDASEGRPAGGRQASGGGAVPWQRPGGSMEPPGPEYGGQWEYAGPERRAVEADVHERLMQALGQLPLMQREAILLHYLYDMKYQEIGRATGVTASTVKSRVRQGMDKLQGALRREDFLD